MSSPATDLELNEGFRAFVAASRRLEQSYAELRERAESIDHELADTNRALQKTLREKETILGSLPVGVLALDSDGACVSRNPEGDRIFAAAEEAGFELLQRPEGEHEVDGLCLAVRRAAMPDGGTLVVVEDRSRLAVLSREVDRLDRIAGLSELALGIAHEIKNPLNGVMGFAQLLERSDDPEAIKRFASKIFAGLKQVDEIVREMLAFARAPSRSGAVTPISAVITEAAAAAGVPQSTIEVRGDSQAEVESTALIRVLANLFRNSAEATGSAVRIEVQIEQHAGHVEATVADNGPGIDSDLGNRIFEPFVSSKDRGHGLGLALASRVMSFLGGSLELVEPENPGATFRLVLPTGGTNP